MNTVRQAYIELCTRYQKFKNNIDSLEATKINLVLPFLQVLTYDVFNPTEVIAAYMHEGHAVDFAVVVKKAPLILVHVEKHGNSLSGVPNAELVEVFQKSAARVAVMTNGVDFQF